MTAIEFRNPHWVNAEHTLLDCEVNHPDMGWIPFTTSADATGPIGKAVWQALNFQEIAPFVPPSLEEKRAAMPTLSARQFRLGLIDGGIDLADVETAIAAIPDPVERKKGQVEWEYATQFNRLHPLVVQLSSSLGLTPEQVDAMWEGAAAL